MGTEANLITKPDRWMGTGTVTGNAMISAQESSATPAGRDYRPAAARKRQYIRRLLRFIVSRNPDAAYWQRTVASAHDIGMTSDEIARDSGATLQDVQRALHQAIQSADLDAIMNSARAGRDGGRGMRIECAADWLDEVTDKD
jgi:hypothetical protein